MQHKRCTRRRRRSGLTSRCRGRKFSQHSSFEGRTIAFDLTEANESSGKPERLASLHSFALLGKKNHCLLFLLTEASAVHPHCFDADGQCAFFPVRCCRDTQAARQPRKSVGTADTTDPHDCSHPEHKFASIASRVTKGMASSPCGDFWQDAGTSHAFQVRGATYMSDK